MTLKFVSFFFSCDALSDDILFCRNQKFQFLTINHGPHGFVFVSLKKVLRKVYHLKGNKNRNLVALVSVA